MSLADLALPLASITPGDKVMCISEHSWPPKTSLQHLGDSLESGKVSTIRGAMTLEKNVLNLNVR